MNTHSLTETIHQLHAALDPTGDASPGHRRYAGRALRRLAVAADIEPVELAALLAGAGSDSALARLVGLPPDRIHLALDGACIRRG